MKKKLMTSAILGLGLILVAPAALAADTIGKITFEPGVDPGKVLELPDTNPPVKVTPDDNETKTELASDGINFTVPNLDFGTGQISLSKETYNPKALKFTGVDDNKDYFLPPTVVVRDIRGSKTSGWDMQISAGELAQKNDATKKIAGAQIKFVTPRVFSNNGLTPGNQEITAGLAGFTFASPIELAASPKPLISAANGVGNLQTTYMLDDESKYTVNPTGEFVPTLTADSKVKGIDLDIPGGVAIDAAVEYNATLTWTMTTAP
ncbi:WxL domain-containing protein [Vagococcus sp. BWB3-3]|uniref:WxL domain-containing protein n=1 Tax=Vagococcus allomyrinae TaxID=2794353 RepID=A0A940STV7_9ENTE|nr:WxL domain-containing protein [Vagococcus allomyrinae]MBP1039461.1 WxL domain-containing protein [Vagococcus allomyrinae]